MSFIERNAAVIGADFAGALGADSSKCAGGS